MIDSYFVSIWVCPVCGESVMVHKEADTSEWKMCTQCEGKEAIRKAEQMSYEAQQDWFKDKMIIPRPISKPHYKYNWKTGKAELIKQ